MIQELTTIASDLENTPRERIDYPALVHLKGKAGQRIRQLAAQIIAIEPVKPPPAVRSARDALYRKKPAPKPRGADPAQLSLLGCAP